jgi:hypothetical protein
MAVREWNTQSVRSTAYALYYFSLHLRQISFSFYETVSNFIAFT